MKSILDDSKKWSEFNEEENVEPQGIYRPLYVAVKAVEEALKAKLEPPPAPTPVTVSRSIFDDSSALASIAVQIGKLDPSMKELLIYQDSYNGYGDIVMLLPKCVLCGEKHRHMVKYLDHLRLPKYQALKDGVDALKNMCQFELGPAGK